jgi:hypothetical protein
LRKILYFLRQIGFDPLRAKKGISNIPHYLVDLFRFLKMGKVAGTIRISPVLNDFKDNAGSADGHYFWQDLITAQWIFSIHSKSHLDVGSRIDGFIAHLLTFRPVTLLDIRPTPLQIPGLTTIQGDAQKNLTKEIGKFDSVSSLHSIEHFGLGRYGDSLDHLGHIKGLIEISECVEEGGSFFVSFPIGKSAVEFNEQRVVDPKWPLEVLIDFTMEKFVLIPWKGSPIFESKPEDVDKSQTGQAGLYWFKKRK